ncbi:MAG: hypothetical protein U0X75_28210 [Acidobacteriota bacterium]
MSKKLYLETHGCQMNVHDSEKAAAFALSDLGYEVTTDPTEADLIMLNTYGRGKAARKVYHHIDELESIVFGVFLKKKGLTDFWRDGMCCPG